MRVLYVTPGCFDKGGISRYSRYQISALRELLGPTNVRVYSLLGPDTGGFEDPFEVVWSAGGVAPRHKAALLARISADALRRKPDWIWVAHVNLSGPAVALGRVTGAKVALNTYGLEVWSGFRLDNRWGLQSADGVLADCRFTAAYLEREHLRRNGTVAVVHDCVDVARFKPGPPSPAVLARYGIPDPSAGFNLLTLGRMSSRAAHKGYERLVEVFHRVAARLPGLRLIYAGGGDLIPKLERRLLELGLRDRAVFTGAIHEADLADVYRAAHIFSLVSDRGVGRGEGLPLTPLEAGASGVPILVGNQDGSAEAIVDGTNGFVLDPHHLEAHAAATVELAENPERRAAMSRAAVLVARRHFTYERFVHETQHLLESWAARND